MASTIPGGDTLIILRRCHPKDYIRVVGFPTLCSRFSDRMGLASVSFGPRIKFPYERSENLIKKWECVLGTYSECPGIRYRKCPTNAYQGALFFLLGPGSVPILTVGRNKERIL